MVNIRIKGTNLTFGYSCNNNCIHCINSYDIRQKYKDRTTEEIKKYMVDTKEKNVEWLIFIGGEVTIRNDFFELLEFAKKLGLKTRIETNARMFCIDEFAKKVFEIMPDLHIGMSFHHTNPKIQDKITRVEGSFNQSVNGIKNMKKYGLKHLTIVPVITRLNYNNLPDLVKFLAKLKVDEIIFMLMRIRGNAQKNLSDLFTSIKEIRPYLFRAIYLGEKLGIAVKTYGFPYCTLGNYKKHAYEINFIKMSNEGKTFIFNELYNPSIDWQKERLLLKAKLPSCIRCSYFNICEGIWKEYLELNIKKVLTPIVGKHINNIVEIE